MVNLMRIEQALLFVLFLFLSSTIIMFNVRAESFPPDLASVEVGVWLVNVEKVDLSAGSYRLDFYLWFRFDPLKNKLGRSKGVRVC